MKLLEERIREEGIVKSGSVLKVDSFINHQMDVMFFDKMGRSIQATLTTDSPINKILTIEASGIGIAIDPPPVLALRRASGGLRQEEPQLQHRRRCSPHRDPLLIPIQQR